MLQTVSTMISLLTCTGAAGVIGFSLWEDRQALRLALAGAGRMAMPPLPPHTHRIAGPRPARFITMSAPAPVRAAA